MKTNNIIIKATDYRYPSRAELLELYKKTPDLPNFGFKSKSPLISIIHDKRKLTDVHRDDNLQYWDHVLLNRNGTMSHSFNTAAVNFARGIPDKMEEFEKHHYINRIQFDYYAEAFYYHFSAVRDTIAQLLNIYYVLGLEINKIHFNTNFTKALPNDSVRNLVKVFIENTSQATNYRNSFAHRMPINTPDSRSSLKEENGKVTYGSATFQHVKTSEIMNNLEITLETTAKFISELKILMV